MAFEPTDLRANLAPGWSGVNIALMVVLFMFFWPFGLAMVAYILLGEQMGLDLGRPHTFKHLGTKLTTAARAAINSVKSANPGITGIPEPEQESFKQWREQETERLAKDRADLEHDKSMFEAEKKAFVKHRENV